MNILIRFQTVSLIAELNDTPTAQKIAAALPFESHARTWGEEVYFSVPVKAELEPGAQQVVEPGTVCFWVQGNALAIPFGPTPIAEADECRLAHRCNILGRIVGGPRLLAQVRDGERALVEMSYGV